MFWIEELWNLFHESRERFTDKAGHVIVTA